MKYLYATLMVIGVYAFFVFGRIIYAANFARVPEIKHKERAFGAGEELRYIAAGDSVARGVGASSVESTFAYGLAGELGKNNKILYKNIAEYGAQTEDFIERQLPQILEYSPDIIVVTIGGNDAVRLHPKEKILGNYRRIIDEIITNTDATLYISNIPKFGEVEPLPGWYVKIVDKKSSKINEEILLMENERVGIIDAYGKFDEIQNTEETFAVDGFHANDYGYTFWQKAFFEKIKEGLR